LADREQGSFREPVSQTVVVLVRVRDEHAQERNVRAIEAPDGMKREAVSEVLEAD
jgi:hypothetical protein